MALAPKIVTLDEESLRLLSGLLERERNRRQNVVVPIPPDEMPGSGGYLAEVPACGITAANLDVEPPYTGYAYCPIHKLVRGVDGYGNIIWRILDTGYTELVHNIYDEVIGGRFAYIERDKYGDWIATGRGITGPTGPCGSSSVGTSTGTGTGTHDNCVTSIGGVDLGSLPVLTPRDVQYVLVLDAEGGCLGLVPKSSCTGTGS